MRDARLARRASFEDAGDALGGAGKAGRVVGAAKAPDAPKLARPAGLGETRRRGRACRASGCVVGDGRIRRARSERRWIGGPGAGCGDDAAGRDGETAGRELCGQRRRTRLERTKSGAQGIISCDQAGPPGDPRGWPTADGPATASVASSGGAVSDELALVTVVYAECIELGLMVESDESMRAYGGRGSDIESIGCANGGPLKWGRGCDAGAKLPGLNGWAGIDSGTGHGIEKPAGAGGQVAGPYAPFSSL